MSAKQSIHIDAPVEEVFDFYKDPRRAWSVMPDQMLASSELTDVKVTKEGVGTYYSWAVKVAGLRLQGFDVYTEFVPNKRITDRSSRMFVGTWTSTFEREGSGTRVTEQREPTSIWLLRPIDRLMDTVRESLNRQTLKKLKAQLETAAEPTPARTAARRSTRG